MDKNNLENLMKEAQKLQQRMQDAQQQLTELKIIGEAGGGMIKLEMNGRHEAVRAKINPALMEEEVEMLEGLVVAVVNDAAQKIEKASKDKITQITSGMNIPTDFLKGEKEE